jgi:HPt (histidine-containing phosphotransfer) domain-containing protein
MKANEVPAQASIPDDICKKHAQAAQALRDCFVDVIADLDARAEIYQVPDFCAEEEILKVFAEHLHRDTGLLQTACAASDELSIRRHGHSMEGMGGMVGFAVLSLVGAELCRAAKEHRWEHCTELAARLRRWCDTQDWRGAS